MIALDHQSLAIKQKLHRLRADAIRRYWRQPHPQRLLHRLSHITDQAINELLGVFPLPSGTACIALGGYGRQEFYPHSDVDLLFLLSSPLRTAAEKRRIEHLVAALWDLGLKVSQTVQTIAQSLESSQTDVTFQTALLEGRFLAGQADVWHRLQKKHNEQLDVRHFYLKKVAELRARHAEFQNTPYALEPNCKESPGGLRDLQLLGWLARVAGVGHDWPEIARSGLLTEAEQKAIQRVAAAFMRLRIELHLLTGKGIDTLRFDLQPRLAQRYGFKDAPGARLGSEILMQRYYWASRLVTQLTTTLLQSFDELLNPPPAIEIENIDEHFAVVNNRLSLKNKSALAAHPENLFKGFLLLQQHPELEGFDALTLRCLWHGRRLIDESFRQNRVHKQLFMAIIKQPQRVFEVLSLMNLFNILPRYIPAFRTIVGQMQHDLFHTYTVDQHTLILIENLCRFSRQTQAADPLLAHQLMQSMAHPWRLIMAALFHDIAKGQGGAHALKGAEMAAAFCQQHLIDEQDSKLIEFLVREHLLFSHYAQKKDFYHPDVLTQFIRIVDSQEKLDALYVLTVADIQATNPKIWTAWKSTLLENLYQLARGVLADQGAAQLVSQRQNDTQQALAPLLTPGSYALRLWQGLDEEYFARHQREVILWHFEQLCHSQRAPYVQLRELPGVSTASSPSWQVMAHAQDQPELFMTLCRVFEQLGIDIQDAQIYTSPGQWVIDTFVVVPTQALLDEPTGPDTVRHALIQALQSLREGYLMADPAPGYYAAQSRQARVFPITPKIELQALQSGRWELNLFGTDRKALLYDIACVFAQFKLNLRSAKIMTLGERVEDSFILESPLLEQAKCREALSHALFKLL